MKKLALPLLFCSLAIAQTSGTFTDSRDSKTYKWVKIGEQVWMAENLNYEAEGSKCYVDSIAYCEKYGRLYDWKTAMALPDSCNKRSCSSLISAISAKHRGICPSGWHLPSNDEWDALLLFVDGTSGTDSLFLYLSKTAGNLLKAKSGWNDYKGKSGNGTDEFGFAALPGGIYHSSYNGFDYVGECGNWWSATEVVFKPTINSPHPYTFYLMTYYAFLMHIHHGSSIAYMGSNDRSNFYSVRCLQD